MLPRAPNQERQVERPGVESNHLIHAPIFAAAHRPKFAQDRGFILVVQDANAAFVQQANHQDARRQRIERSLLEEIDTVMGLSFGDFRGDLIRIFQIARFDLSRIERRHQRGQFVLRQSLSLRIEEDRLNGVISKGRSRRRRSRSEWTSTIPKPRSAAYHPLTAWSLPSRSAASYRPTPGLAQAQVHEVRVLCNVRRESRRW